MKLLRTSLLITLAGLLQSCFDSDEHIFDEADSIDITVDATISRTMAITIPSVKADTFNTSDTVYFLTSINPNKIINVQDYYWLMDGVQCSSDYNFKKQITEPGYHKFMFVLKDHFGDMHYDSLEVWVADSPTLNDSTFTPANGTQAIDPSESIFFTWSAHTEGIRLAHRYRFTLSEQNYTNTETQFVTIDTILTEPHYIYHNKLYPFKKYNWTVQAINEYGFSSEERIESSFFTKGKMPGEGSLQATISTSQDLATPVQLSLQNSDNPQKKYSYSYSFSRVDNKISTGAVPAGTYQLTISSSYPDFGEYKKDVVINEGYVTVVDGIRLVDSIKPSVVSYSGLDTLNFADSLKFIIKDGGGAISAANVSVHLENDLVTDKFFKDSILTVILRKNEKSWAYRILTVTVNDGSQNTLNKSFYISPSELWFKTNSDTTITSDQSIVLFINENNPFKFEIDTLKFFNLTTNTPIVSIPNTGKRTFSAELEAQLFDAFQTIRSSVIYTNGIVQHKDWNLYIKNANAKEEE
jgi:hypothetical protein